MQKTTFRASNSKIWDQSNQKPQEHARLFTTRSACNTSLTVSTFTIDASFLSLPIETVIDNNCSIVGLQKFYNKDSSACFRVACIQNGVRIIRTIDAVYLDNQRYAYRHLKRKICQMWMINVFCTNYVNNICELFNDSIK